MKILKRTALIFIIIFLSTFFSEAQSENEFSPVYSFGIKQGINSSTVNFSPGINQGLKLGYNAGIVFKHRNEKIFGLQIELNYCQKGWTENLDTINNSYNRTLNYIELPLITQVVLGKRPNLKYYLNLGTSFAYMLSEKENMVLNEINYRRDYYEKKVENIFDYSALGEIGLTYNTTIGEFQMGIRYQLTFTDLFKSNKDTIFDNSQSQMWSFSITYFFIGNGY